MNDDVNVPMDATAMQAEEIVKAAIAWAWEIVGDPRLTRAEWKLIDACKSYGDDFKGLRAR